ncbi:hypothetical protein DsansV1_C06g0062741 [Dioscorea sansibarensis]
MRYPVVYEAEVGFWSLFSIGIEVSVIMPLGYASTGRSCVLTFEGGLLWIKLSTCLIKENWKFILCLVPGLMTRRIDVRCKDC